MMANYTISRRTEQILKKNCWYCGAKPGQRCQTRGYERHTASSFHQARVHTTFPVTFPKREQK
jgi:hypothetical protein